jgi:voltage-gated potassium channel
MSIGLKSAFCHDSDEPGGFDRIDERFHNWPRASRHRGRARVVEVFSLNAKVQSRPDLLLLLSLLVAILLTPVLNQDNWRRLVLVAITFIPIILSIVRLSQIKRWVWPSVLLALGNAVFVVAGNTFPSPTLTGIRWAFLAAFFGLTATGLFSYLRSSRSVAQAELYTAVNIYLLLGLLWAAIYLAIDAFSPGSIRIGSDPSDRQTELLYFSLITLSTVGYGDIVPLSGMARILTALEGVTGVLYIATTVAVLVGRFRNESWE